MKLNKTLRLTKKVTLLLALAIMFVMAADTDAQTPQTVTIKGQFVCSQCWFEADRKTTVYGTAADMECAKECAEQKVPPAIAVKEGDDYKLFLVEEGRFKKKGEDWLEYIAKQVEVTGRLRASKDQQYIALDKLTVISDAVEDARQSNAVGTAPDLVLKDLFGFEQSLSAYRGKIVVLNFWATWCVPCRKEMPDLAHYPKRLCGVGGSGSWRVG